MIVIWRYHKRELISLQDVFFLKTTIANRYPRGQGILLGPTNFSHSKKLTNFPHLLVKHPSYRECKSVDIW